MYSRTGDKVEPESRPILDTFDPKREERIRVVTQSAEGTFENVCFFVFPFSRPGRLVLLGQKVGSQEEVGRGDEEQRSLSTHCVPEHLLSTRACTSPFPFFPTTLEGKGFCFSIT